MGWSCHQYQQDSIYLEGKVSSPPLPHRSQYIGSLEVGAGLVGVRRSCGRVRQSSQVLTFALRYVKLAANFFRFCETGKSMDMP